MKLILQNDIYLIRLTTRAGNIANNEKITDKRKMATSGVVIHGN